MDLTEVEAILEERKAKLNLPSFRFNPILRVMRIRLLAPTLKNGNRHSRPCISYFYALGNQVHINTEVTRNMHRILRGNVTKLYLTKIGL